MTLKKTISDGTPTLTTFAQQDRINVFVRSIALFILAILPFLPALHGQMIWDDDQSISANPAVQVADGLKVIWNPANPALHYFPMNFTVLWAGYQLWGGQVEGYHLLNFALHACNAVLLWRILRHLGLKCPWLAALLWAVHPVQVESVAWISELKNTLSGFFFLLSVLAFFRFQPIDEVSINPPPRSRRWGAYILFMFLFALGVLSKSLICSLPVMLALIWWWKHGTLRWREVWPLIPPLIVGIAGAALTASREHELVGDSREVATLHFQFIERCIIASKSVCLYVEKLIWPYPLMPIYPRWDYSMTQIVNYLPMICLIAATMLLWSKRKTWGRGPITAWLYFLITLAPVLGFVNYFTMLYTFAEDHFQYLACLSLIALATQAGYLGWQKLVAFRPQLSQGATLLSRAMALVVIALMCTSAAYASLYQSSLRLWTWTTEKNPDAYAAQHNLAIVMYTSNNKTEAYARLEKSLNTFPLDPEAWRALGQFQMTDHRFAQAKDSFFKAIACRNDYGLYYTLLGLAEWAMGQREDAMLQYAKGVQISGGDPDTLMPFAQALIVTRQYPEAEKVYRQLLLNAPGNAVTHFHLANALVQEGKFSEGIEQYELFLRLSPGNSLAWNSLATAYYKAGRVNDAVAAQKRARELDPGNTSSVPMAPLTFQP